MDAQPARYYYTWEDNLDGALTIEHLHEVLDRARKDRVPVDAVFQVSGSRVYLTWQRDAS